MRNILNNLSRNLYISKTAEKYISCDIKYYVND